MTDLDSIFRRHWPDVLRFSLYLCGHRDEAEDLASETFLRAWTSTQPIRIGTVRAYLFMIARNLHRDRLRRREPAGPLDDSCEPLANPEADVQERGELERVLAAMRRLPEADRAVLAMAAFSSMPYDVIAAALGLSVSAVKVRVHRARLKLGVLLEPDSSRTAP